MNNRKLLFALLCMLAATQTGCMMNNDNMVRRAMVDLAFQNLLNNDNFQAQPANPGPVQDLNPEDIDRQVRDADVVINDARDRIARNKRIWNGSWHIAALLPGFFTGNVLFSAKLGAWRARIMQRIDPAFIIPDNGVFRFADNTSWSKIALITAAIGAAWYFTLRSLRNTRMGKNMFDYPEVVRAKNDLNAHYNERNQLYQQLYRRYAADGGQRANERARAAGLQRRQQADRAEMAQLQQAARIGRRDIRRAALRAEILRQIEHDHPELLAVH